MKDNRIEKIADITKVMISHNVGDLSKTKWNKLLFFIDSAYFNSPQGNTKRTMTGYEYIKMPYGPMIDNFQNILDNFINYNLKIKSYIGYSSGMMTFIEIGKGEKNTKFILNKDEINIIKKVVGFFGKFNATQLSDFSHMLDAWLKSEMFSPIDFKATISDSFLRSKTSKSNMYELFFSKASKKHVQSKPKRKSR